MRSQAVYAPSRYESFRFNKNLTLAYTSLCLEYYACKEGQYLKDCGFVDGDPVKYREGICTDCMVSYISKKCNDEQYLSGCEDLSPGECTNCSTVHCDSGYQLVNCSNIMKGVCVLK